MRITVVSPKKAEKLGASVLACVLPPGFSDTDAKGEGRSGKHTTRRDKDLLDRLRELTGSSLEAADLRRLSFGGKGQGTLIVPESRKSWSYIVLLDGSDAEEPKRGFELGKLAARAVRTAQGKSIALMSDGGAFDFESGDMVRGLVWGLSESLYEYSKGNEKKETGGSECEELLLVTDAKLAKPLLDECLAVAAGQRLARDLVHLPPNYCYPLKLAAEGKKVAQSARLKCTVFDERRLETMKAGGILGVAAGSAHRPCLIKLEYTPAGKIKKTVALVGKGVTFDSGGISIKPAQSMDEMKGDMAGGAAVLGAMMAIGLLRPQGIQVRGYIPAVENMPGGRALRPADVLTTLSGKTVEVLNTDAEGRLILADALALAERDGADEIIDLATLTGAALVALGEDVAALLSDNDELANRVSNAAAQAYEKVWRMPLVQEYRDQLMCAAADLKNIGNGRNGGTIIAALFLREFVTRAPWAHLDIAGPGMKNIAKGKAVGFGVRTLVTYLLG